MDWKSANTKDDGAVEIPGRWLYLHYYEALNILFRMENALRIFVYVILKNKFKDKWSETAIQTAEEEQSTIAAIAARRMAQAKGFGYLGYEITSPLMYLNSGELTRLITSDAYWEIFKPHFRGRKEIIRTKLEEIGTVRNALAHFRPLKYDDIELIKQNVKHAFVGIEQCLAEMTDTHRVVPTNTAEKWYQNLATVGSNLCTVQLFQDSSANWFRVEIRYACAVLRTSPPGKHRYFTVSNLISPALIRHFPKLACYCIFVTELVPYTRVTEDNNPEFRKLVSLVFARSSIIGQHEAISGQLKDILFKIETETELLQNDNLARGELIDSARITSALQASSDGKHQWRKTDYERLKCEFAENDPAEYWGEIGRSTSDFISGTSSYPWMPSSISKDDSFDW
jgi:hypothetical protein